MSDIPFHATQMGHRFYVRDVPELVALLARLNTTLERVAAALEQHVARGTDPIASRPSKEG